MDKIISKSSIQPELSAIYFTPEKMVATDSFRLIEVKKGIDIAEPRLLKAKGFKGRGTVTIDDNNLINDGGKLIQGERVDGDYPDYEKACFENGKPKFSMYVNAKLLAELLAEVDAQGQNSFHKVRLDFFDPLKPLLITTVPGGGGPDTSVRAALSPMTS